uniref:Uncharacterized protein n=1 Tax=Knipowitschia caucasica TaxID=637954 RepID=A0AAV2LFC5_KNICA
MGERVSSVRRRSPNRGLRVGGHMHGKSPGGVRGERGERQREGEEPGRAQLLRLVTFAQNMICARFGVGNNLGSRPEHKHGSGWTSARSRGVTEGLVRYREDVRGHGRESGVRIEPRQADALGTSQTIQELRAKRFVRLCGFVSLLRLFNVTPSLSRRRV